MNVHTLTSDVCYGQAKFYIYMPNNVSSILRFINVQLYIIYEFY